MSNTTTHNLQKYISLTLLQTLEKLCKKRDHGMVDLQHVLTETLRACLVDCNRGRNVIIIHMV